MLALHGGQRQALPLRNQARFLNRYKLYEIDLLDEQAMPLVYHFIQSLKFEVKSGDDGTQYYDWLAQDEADLQALEKQYQLSSREFYQQFQQGIYPLTVEWVTWAKLFEITEQLRQYLKLRETGQAIDLPSALTPNKKPPKVSETFGGFSFMGY